MNACMCTVRVCGMYPLVLVYDGAYSKKNVLFSFFFLLFCWILSQQVLLALEVVFGLAFSITDVKYVSGLRAFRNKRVSRSSQMNLCKWLFDNVASLICQLCLFKQTLPCGATQSLESADSTSEIKYFQLKQWDSSLTSIFRVECIIKLASRAGCLSDSVV